MKHNEYRVLPRIPADARLTADRHTDTVFPVTRFSSREECEKRREELRFSLRMAAGLYPWPEKNPLGIRREPVALFDDYAVEKIMFESRPGFWSTGNLYLPRNTGGPAPAILCVIGHWQRQRLYRGEDADYPAQFANFARMGFVVLTTDMIGMVDSRQISHEYGGGEKELWLSNGLGVQLWNNIRALDVLEELPEADASRIGVTGASGGGSQTLFLTLADDRIKAAAPINMISLRMQGGCACENAPGLRRGTDNGEMCALLAPTPLFLAGSTGDWTVCQETEEVPGVLGAYRYYAAEPLVSHYYQVADHQYNAKTRRRVYSFFARHLMGRETEWEEQPADIGDVLDLTWFRDEGQAPGLAGDEGFFAAFRGERREAVARQSAEEKKKMLSWITGITGAPAVEADGTVEHIDGMTAEKSVVTSLRGEQIPFVRLTPDGWDGKHVCLVLSGRGKDCLADPEVKALVDGGTAVVSGDLFLTGEYEGAAVGIRGGDQGKKYFTTFHYTADAYRAQDAALLWQLVRRMGVTDADRCIRADGCGARAAACALPLLEGVSRAELENDALALNGEADYMEKCFIPGLLAFGGLDACLALAPCPLGRF